MRMAACTGLEQNLILYKQTAQYSTKGLYVLENGVIDIFVLQKSFKFNKGMPR